MRTKNEVSSSVNLTISPDTPQTTSVPPTLTFKKPKLDRKDQTDDNKGGWEAQFMQLRKSTFEKVASFQGGSDVDLLSLAPGSDKGGNHEVIAVDLAVNREPLLCCLTERAFCVYEVPELFSSKNNVPKTSSAVADPNRVTLSSLSTVPRVYKKKESLTSWWNQSDSDLFGDVPATRIPQRVEDENSLHASGRSLDRGLAHVDLELPIVENIANLVVAEKNTTLSQDERDTIPTTTINEVGVETKAVIDLSKAKRCPCPPLCGIAFGRAGKVVAFNNGPVKKMWTWYQTSPTDIRSYSASVETLVLKENEVAPATLDSVDNKEQKAEDYAKSETPRTLFDLIEMTSAGEFNYLMYQACLQQQPFSPLLFRSQDCTVGDGQ
jgi:hypothetical protein